MGRIYPPELQLNKTNASDTEAPSLNLHLSISTDLFHPKCMISTITLILTNFPFSDGDVPRSTSLWGYISQLIRFAIMSSYVTDFNALNKILPA